MILKPVAKKAGHLLYCIHIPVGQISPALGFSKVPETGVIMLLGVRQVGLLGPFLWQECHKRRKAKAENKKEAHGRGKVLEVYASQHFSSPVS